MTRTRNLASVISTAIENRLVDVHTAMPGRIDKYDAATQTADIQPLLRRPIIDQAGNEVIEELPIIPKVPIVFPRGGGYFCSFPMAEGDPVLLVFSERSIDQWQEKGDLVDPGDQRLHGLSGAYAIPGGASEPAKLADAHADNMVCGQDGGKQMHFKGSTIALGVENPGDNLALASLVKSEISALRNTVNNHLKAGGTYLIHTHPSAVGPTGVPIPPSVPPAAVGDVKSTVIEAE